MPFARSRLAFCLFVLSGLIFGCTVSAGTLFVPERFSVPISYKAKGVFIQKLTREYAELDYEAVMDSRHELRGYFGGEWPADTFSLEQNIKDIVVHEMLFEDRSSFAYTVLSADRTRVLGCIYINPTDSAGYDAQVHSWVRTGEEIQLSSLVKDWLETDWPFQDVLYW